MFNDNDNDNNNDHEADGKKDDDNDNGNDDDKSDDANKAVPGDDGAPEHDCPVVAGEGGAEEQEEEEGGEEEGVGAGLGEEGARAGLYTARAGAGEEGVFCHPRLGRAEDWPTLVGQGLGLAGRATSATAGSVQGIHLLVHQGVRLQKNVIFGCVSVVRSGVDKG